MKSLVVYSSQSGNTRKLAQALFDSLAGEKELVALAEAPDPKGYAFIGLGFWFKAGQPDPASQEYLARIKDGQDLYLFATHGTATGSDHARNGMKRAKELAAGAHIIATFTCPGELPAKVMEMMAAKDPQPPWFKDAPAAKGLPDETDCRNVARMLQELDLP